MAKAQILIVEDDNITVLELRDRLQSLGYAVCAVASYGEEAIEKAGETRPDVVLMDIRLRGATDGIEAAEEIRARFDIPVVYLTAYADEDTLQRAKVTEPCGYIIKPFEERELHSVIEMALYKHEMERKLKESERWLATTLRSIGDGVIATDEKGLVTFMNPVAGALTGWKWEDALGKDFTEVFNIVNEQTRARPESLVTRVIREGVVVGLANHSMLIAKDGREIPIDDSAAPIRDDKGNITGVVLVFRDITERKWAEQQVLVANERLQYLLSSTSAVIYTAKTSGDYGATFISENVTQMVGYEPREFLEESSFWIDHVHPEDVQRILTELPRITEQERHAYEYRFRRKDGTYIWMRDEMKLVRDEGGEPLEIIGYWADITERKRAEETIRHLAYHDTLTGLPNRRLFNNHLNLALAHAYRNQEKLAVMILDLDNFKDVNDTLGHSVGDQLLQVVSERLTSLLRKGDTVARMGGDEFMLLLSEIAQVEDADEVAQKILEALREPFVFDSHDLRITTSIGIALYPDAGEDCDTLMKNADIAMYRAKDLGRDNYQSWQPIPNI